MDEIVRKDVSEEWAHSGIVKAGDYCFLSYCVGNVGGTVEPLGGLGEILLRAETFPIAPRQLVLCDWMLLVGGAEQPLEGG